MEIKQKAILAWRRLDCELMYAHKLPMRIEFKMSLRKAYDSVNKIWEETSSELVVN